MGRLRLPRTAEADAHTRELQDYEIKVDQEANEKYGAFKAGTHDLMTAIGLAVQLSPGQSFVCAAGGERDSGPIWVAEELRQRMVGNAGPLPWS